MRVIGAGLPRTGTLTQKVALEMLGLGPCYHMVDVLADLDQAGLWERALDGEGPWAEILDGFNSTVDWPGDTSIASSWTSIPTPRSCSASASPRHGSTACARPCGRCATASP